MMAQPPTTSLASAYGPSTRLTSPLRTTKFTASSVPNRPPPSRNTPLAARSPTWASIASNSDCGGVPTPSSILTNPMKRGISITPNLGWLLLLEPTSNGSQRLRHRPLGPFAQIYVVGEATVSRSEQSGFEVDDDLVDRIAGRDEGAAERSTDREQEGHSQAHHGDEA